MAEAIVSALAERLTALIEEQIRNEVNLIRGVDREVLKLSNELKTIRNVLDDAEKRGFKERSVKDWLLRLEDTSYEMDDVLDEWHYAILKLKIEQSKVWFSIQSPVLYFKKIAVRHDIAKKIKNVKAQLDQISYERDRYNFVTSLSGSSTEPQRVQSTDLIDLAEVHGRDSDRDILVSKLIPDCCGPQELGLHVHSIVGVGGVGKTTLAQLVYNDSRVKECFDLRIWICVSDPFDEAGIVKGIIESVRGSSPNTQQLNILCKHLIESISGKRFLLVLDDVWTEDYNKWEPLKNSLQCGLEGSAVLVTTRNERVAEIMGTRNNNILNLEQLNNDDCWLLLRRLAFSRRTAKECENLEGIGKKIANKCKGLPLAAKTLGSLLCFKSSLAEWENVLNSEIWQLERVEVELFPHLLLSYNELSPTLKRCFSYCAVFPKDSLIDVEDLVRNWMAQGYLGPDVGDMERKGQECFEILAKRSLFQDFKKDDSDGRINKFKMHDIVHDFAQFLRKNGRMEVAGMKNATCQLCDPLFISGAKQYRSLFYPDPSLNFCDCLITLRALSLGLRFGCVPQEIGKLIHLRWLNLSGIQLPNREFKSLCKLYYLQYLWLQYCTLSTIPHEIGNLIHLRLLDLSFNRSFWLPESICGLHELRTLNLDGCTIYDRFPEGMHKLVNLKHLRLKDTHLLFPQGLSQLTALRTLTEFVGGRHLSKLGLLKKLNHLRGSLELCIKLLANDTEDMVADARAAELREKKHIQKLTIRFYDDMDEMHESVRMGVIDALEPHLNMKTLDIQYYKGCQLPGWIASPLNQLREICLTKFSRLSSLPPLGQLPCLEEIKMHEMESLQFVGRQFLGITGTSTDAFPALKKLTFSSCLKWEEWGDITAEEEFGDVFSLMPCLAELNIVECRSLTALPYRLLSKASSLKKVKISNSWKLERYKDKDNSAWKDITQNPRFQVEY